MESPLGMRHREYIKAALHPSQGPTLIPFGFGTVPYLCQYNIMVRLWFSQVFMQFIHLLILNIPHTNHCNPSGIVDIYFFTLFIMFSLLLYDYIHINVDVCLKLVHEWIA